MTKIQEYINELKEKSDKRFDDFDIIEIDNINSILDKAYIDKPTWLGGDKEFVCLFIDLDKSSKKSFKKHPKTMAKIYDYFTQNIVDVLNHPTIGADYIDIKGDGAFGVFGGDQASFKAFYCAITFKTLFEEKIKNKFGTEEESLGCKIGIHKDKVLVRRIGKRGEGNYNEVWAGKLVNNASKLASQKIEPSNLGVFDQNLIFVSDKVYKDFEDNEEFGLYRCCDVSSEESVSIINQKVPVFTRVEEPSEETLGDCFYKTDVRWCNKCADKYIDLIR
ncbi:hypothetical protein GW764_01565 [Candidatus Parcubacteria bacterium]|nr:hypothetical protein [Candidatus Parcubacteria bacterium]